MENRKTYLQGLFYGIISNLAWGFFPLYWILLKDVEATEVLANRIIWSFFFMLLYCTLWKKEKILYLVKDRKLMLQLFICGAVMSINWGVYIWAVTHNHVLDASLGYFIIPLILVAIGAIFFKEKFNLTQLIAIILAFVGVAYFTWQHGSFPVVGMVIAISFAIYGSIKKQLKIESMLSLTLETAMMLPFALAYLIYLISTGQSAFTNISISTDALLICAGIVTALPLLWFGISATKIPFSTNGFLQYISPTCQLFLGIFFFNESFTKAHTICFSFIWVGLALYSADMIYQIWKEKKQLRNS